MASRNRKLNELTFKCGKCKEVFGMLGSKVVVKKSAQGTKRIRYCEKCSVELGLKK